MIELKQICLCEDAEAIDVRLPSKEIYAVLGPAGAGKSTLLSLMAGCLYPERGQVKVNGFDTKKDPLRAKRCIGYLASDAPTYDRMSAEDLLFFVAETRGLAYERALREVRELLEVAELETIKDRQIGKLSLLEQRKLGVILTSVGNTDTLLFDEPTKGLPYAEEREAVLSLISYLGEGRTVFLSGKDPDELLPLCTRALILDTGTLCEDLSPSEFSRERYDAICAKAQKTQDDAPDEQPQTDGEYELIDEEEGRS